MSRDFIEIPAVLFAGGQPIDGAMVELFMAPARKRAPNPKVAYIGAANGDREAFFEMVSQMMLEAGAASVDFVRLAREQVDTCAAKATLAAADVIFISGGEVEDGMNWLKKHGLAGFLVDLYKEGRQFAGISAGTIMLGSHWVRWENPDDDGTAELFDCLGIVPNVFDTHAENEDWIELKTVLRLMGDGSRGYGLPAGGVIGADGAGRMVNYSKEYLTFVNESGSVHIEGE